MFELFDKFMPVSSMMTLKGISLSNKSSKDL